VKFTPGHAERGPRQHQRECRGQRGRGEGEHHVRDDLEDQRPDQDPAGAEPVDRGAPRPDDQEPDQRRQPEQQANVPEGDVADLVEVDDVEREHQAGADELEDDDRQEQLPLARQVVPEGGEGRSGGGLLAHRVQSTNDNRQSARGFPTPQVAPGLGSGS
jgi:hypothetical protein